MSERAAVALPSPALDWLRAHPTAAERARAAAPTGQALPDVLLADPSRLVDMFGAAVTASIEEKAPAGVTEELVLAWREMGRRAGRLKAQPELAERLAGLRGLRDRSELLSALEQGRDTYGDADPLVAVAARAAVFLGPDGTTTDEHIPGLVDIDAIVVDVTDPGTTDPGTTDPGTTDGGTTDASTTDRGATDRGTSRGTTDGATTDRGTTDATVREPTPAEVVADAGARIGAEVGLAVGGEEAAVTGAQYGAQQAVGLSSQFGVVGTPAGVEPGTGVQGASSSFWGLVAATVGFLVAGPAGAAIGYPLGVGFGASGVGQTAAGVIGSVAGPILDTIGSTHPTTVPGWNLETLMACVLCGETCLPCVLAAESGNH